MPFLRTQRTSIVLDKKTIMLRGVNLGGWLMMEGYFMHSANVAEQVFKKKFAKALGKKALRDFEKRFRDNFIREEDVRNIARLGFNCLRLPFHYRLIETKPFTYDRRGLAYLDRAIRWARKYRLWVILDLHAAPGAQNHDWHSDSLGKAGLWDSQSYQRRTLALWELLADRYKNETAVAGYDVLNEAVTDNIRTLNMFYRNVIRAIRKHDKNHIVFIEGNQWAQDLECLADFDDDNWAMSLHYYEPLDFSFNFVPQLRYPWKTAKGKFNRNDIQRRIGSCRAIARKRGVPVLVGEFGINARAGLYNEDIYLRDVLACFAKAGFHWTYWTYKAVKNSIFPDGIYSYYANPPWVHRQGPLTGWDNYAACWPKQRQAMCRSWRTKEFQANTEVLKVLRKAAKAS